jgi:hypothetical protein
VCLGPDSHNSTTDATRLVPLQSGSRCSMLWYRQSLAHGPGLLAAATRRTAADKHHPQLCSLPQTRRRMKAVPAPTCHIHSSIGQTSSLRPCFVVCVYGACMQDARHSQNKLFLWVSSAVTKSAVAADLGWPQSSTDLGLC